MCHKKNKIIISIMNPRNTVRCGIDVFTEMVFPCRSVIRRHFGNIDDLLVSDEKENSDIVITDVTDFDGGLNEIISKLKLLKACNVQGDVIFLTSCRNYFILKHLVENTPYSIISMYESLCVIKFFLLRAINGETVVSPVVDAIVNVSDRGCDSIMLSPSESRVIRLILQGLTVGLIARQLNLSIKTISAQKRSAMIKLNVKNEVSLFSYFMMESCLLDYSNLES
ncbi:LuxR C-terminal-related transcriptional regulator [Serratia fonticola]|uniref:LuxR C-terminal-related transcriptional regulator n=1 Tax=Serratia fonticola TaxID=47917 RepID=UPI00093ADF92|nr:response regulator transcription factor [Serratia fonticola]OKP21411.1 hypothetical protein BSQ40_25890 [Serratia fonticola]